MSAGVFEVVGRIDGNELHIDLWLMSCRVLKRDMENAMMDMLVKRSLEHGVARIRGYYFPTAKNGMVKEFYHTMGFAKESEDEEGNSVWTFDIGIEYTNKNKVIKVVG